MTYKVTDYYSPVHDRGIQFDDPALGIEWPVTRETAHLSDKDKLQVPLSGAARVFE